MTHQPCPSGAEPFEPRGAQCRIPWLAGVGRRVWAAAVQRGGARHGIGLLAVLWVGCGCGPSSPAPPRSQPAQPLSFVLLHTSDEHGWLLPDEQGEGVMAGGAAEMAGLWAAGGQQHELPRIVLSSGDMWTGPALSTWYQGQPMLEAMGAMGYGAAAVGNHEFDFGLEVLRRRQAESSFPFLAANVATSDGKPVDFAVPYATLEVGGAGVGVVGLARRDTPLHTTPSNVAGLRFEDYAAALRRYVPELRRLGVCAVVVLAHLCAAELAELADQVAELELPLLLGGHCHERAVRRQGASWILESGSYLAAYSEVHVSCDPAAGLATVQQVRQLDNAWPASAGPAMPPDPAVAAIVERWQARVDPALARVLGHTVQGLGRAPALYNMVTDAWLWAYPEAQIALCNAGAFRQNLGAGDITVADLVSVLPFENTLYIAKLTGAQLVQSLSCCGKVVVAGLEPTGRGYRLSQTGEPLLEAATYRVLVNSYMYAGGGGFEFQRYDPDARDTGIGWRQPVIDWIVSRDSSPAKPLESLIDARAQPSAAGRR
jgi:5'-nucleotidase/UDP-sugar diphosphatase